VSRRLAGAPTPAGQPCVTRILRHSGAAIGPMLIIAFDDQSHTREQACRVYCGWASTRQCRTAVQANVRGERYVTQPERQGC
jgi:hypothetical protein